MTIERGTAVGKRPRPRRRRRTRRWRLLTRALPLALLAAAAFAYGVYQAGAAGRADQAVAAEYVHAWAHGDYRTMYSLLDPSSRRRLSEAEFVNAYAKAADTTTVKSIRIVSVGPGG